jgi:hypothetical protein
MQLLRFTHLLVAFLLELVMIGVFARWGFSLGKDTIWKYVIAIAMALLVIVLWGIFAAPKSQYRLSFTPRIVFGTVLFCITAFLMYTLGYERWAMVFLGVSLASQTVAFFSGD